MNINKIKFATGNENKLLEARQILEIDIEQFKVDLVEIQSVSVEEVVEHKAKEAFRIAGEPILIEDTGLSFDAIGGLPGALIKWFDINLGNEGMCQLLNNFDKRDAVAVSCFALYNGSVIKKGVGKLNGMIATEPLGDGGFGWDSIFIPNGYRETFAQMSANQKNKLSMRAIALENLKKVL